MNCNKVEKLLDMKKDTRPQLHIWSCDGWGNIICCRRICMIQHRDFGHSL